MSTPDTTRDVIVIDTPPTPNGDLHIGHLAGPFINADVHARYLRALGRPVMFSTGTDDSQTFVAASARRRGVGPADLAAASHEAIGRTLESMAISIDGYAGYDDGYRAAALDFVGTLHDAGKFELRTVRLPYDERTGEFLVEGLITGFCPVCLTDSRGGLCENCGHPNANVDLLDARSTVEPSDELTTREAQILVLPLERYRDRIAAYYCARELNLRPHTLQVVREMLARPLPDFPITYPVAWGIEAPFPETPGQVLNSWVEGIPAVMYCTSVAAEQLGRPSAPYDHWWLADRDADVRYFIGFDNVYFWGITHLALLMAHEGRYVVPEVIVSNEFYELENDKFSTSLGHVLHSRDLLADVSRDVIRFYLALSNPEHQRANFSRAALEKVCAERLVGPWNQLGALLSKAIADLGVLAQPMPVSDAGRDGAASILARFATCYEIGSYSLTRAADIIVLQLGRLAKQAAELVDRDSDEVSVQVERLGDLFAQLRALVAGASPILVDLAAAVTAAGGFDGSLRPEDHRPAMVAPFTLPTLDERGGRR